MPFDPTVFVDGQPNQFDADEANKLGAGIQAAQETADEALTVATVATGGLDAAQGRRYALHQVSGNTGWTTPDAPGLDITDKVDMRVLVRPDTWTPAAVETFLAKWVGSTDQRSYSFGYSNAGRLRFQFTTDGTVNTQVTLESSNTAFLQDVFGAARLGPVWLRCVGESSVANPPGPNVSRATFYYSYDEVAWTQIGSSITNPTTGPFFNSTSALVTGSQANTVLPYGGRMYEALVYDGSNTLQAWMDFRIAPTPPANYVGDPTGRTWTPRSGAALFTDQTNWQDFLDQTLTIIKLVGGPNGYVLRVDPATGKPTWMAPAQSSSFYNILDYGGTGNYADDASGPAAAAEAAIDPDVGGVIYFPGPPLTPGFYRMGAAGFSTIKPNVVLRGDPTSLGWTGNSFPGGTRTLQTLGGSQILSDAGVVGFTAGNGTGGQKIDLMGPRIQDMVFSPLWLRVGAPLSAGNLVIKSNDAAKLAAWAILHPGPQDIWVQDTGGKVAKMHYTGVDTANTQLTGVTIASELIPGSTYGANALITIDNALGGVHINGTSNYLLRGCVFNGFNDQGHGAYALSLDGSLGSQVEPQYGVVEDCAFWQNYRSVKVTGAQGRFHACTLDGGTNNPNAITNVILVDIVDPGQGMMFTQCAFQGADTHIKAVFGAQNRRNGFQGFGNRHEAWAASGYALDIGVNGVIYVSRFGTSHASGKVFNIQAGATNNTIIMTPATAAGEGTWQDAGTGTRVINLINGQMYGFGSQQYTSAARSALAASVGKGTEIYDTDLSMPLWSDGTNFRDGAGTIR